MESHALENRSFGIQNNYQVNLVPGNYSASSLNGSNLLSSPPGEDETGGRDENLAKVEIATLSVILFLAIVGNTLMLLALWKILQFRPMSRMYFFMLNLSIADLFVAFGNILPQLAWDITFRFQGPDLLCRVVKFLQVFVLYLSSYVLTSMAVDRYFVICRHNFARNLYASLRGPKVLIILSYVLSFLLASPQAFIFSIKDTETDPKNVVLDCWVKFEESWGAKAYVTYFVGFAFGLPLLIIGFCYGAICLKVIRYRLPPETRTNNKKNTKKGENNKKKPSMSDTTTTSRSDVESSSGPTAPGQQQQLQNLVNPNLESASLNQRNALRRQISEAKMKTLKLTFVIIICFFICWSPFCITQMFMVYGTPNVGAHHVIMLLLASLNSCVNPWIYLAFSESLCNQLRIFLGLGLKRGTDGESIGDEAKEQQQQKPNRPVPNNNPKPKQEEGGGGGGEGEEEEGEYELLKINLVRRIPLQTSPDRDSPPSDQCDPKPETKSDCV